MTSRRLYNNIGIEAIAIMLILQKANSLSLAKTLLILPLVTHKELLGYLANGNVKIKSLEKLIIDKTSYFSNFNKRFYDHLCDSLNAVQFLHEIDAVEFRDSELTLKTAMPFIGATGRRGEKMQKASENIAVVLAAPVEKLYLNLRVEL